MIRQRWFSWHELQLMTYFDFMTYSKLIIDEQIEEDKQLSKELKNE